MTEDWCRTSALCSVLRRLVTLLSAQATLIASNEASLKQAESASEMAKKLMEEKEHNAGSENKENMVSLDLDHIK